MFWSTSVNWLALPHQKANSLRKFAVLRDFTFSLIYSTGSPNKSYIDAHLKDDSITRQSREFTFSAATCEGRIHGGIVQEILHGKTRGSGEKVPRCNINDGHKGSGIVRQSRANYAERRVRILLFSRIHPQFLTLLSTFCFQSTQGMVSFVVISFQINKLLSVCTRFMFNLISFSLRNPHRMMTKHAQNRKRFGRRNFKQRYFRLTTQSLSYAKAKGKRPICDIPLTELVAVERLEERSFKMQNIFRVSFDL